MSKKSLKKPASPRLKAEVNNSESLVKEFQSKMPTKFKSSEREEEGGSSKSLADLADKHECYQEAVQAVDKEVKNLVNIYMEIRDSTILLPSSRGEEEEDFDFLHRLPNVLREDFCGTAILCREWVSRNIMRTAIGVDLDSNVIKYARGKLEDDNFTDRVQLYCDNVMTICNDFIPKADILAALNYAVCYFHHFDQLVGYFKRVIQCLAKGGIFVCDIFGGQRKDLTDDGSIFRRHCSNFVYHFRKSPLNLLTNTCNCYIDFIFKDGSSMRNAFSYHFRIWSIGEIRDAMYTAGFKRVETWVLEGDSSSLGESVGSDFEQNFVRIVKNNLQLSQPWNAYVIGVL